MVATNIFTSEATGEEWVIDIALLEMLNRRSPNVILLVRDITNTMHRVVFQNRMVAGDWYTDMDHQDRFTGHLYIKFHFTGNDNRAVWHRYDPMIGTSAWIRASDSRVFVEASDIQAARLAYDMGPPARRAGTGVTGTLRRTTAE
jgi:hypothetical protein